MEISAANVRTTIDTAMLTPNENKKQNVIRYYRRHNIYICNSVFHVLKFFNN